MTDWPTIEEYALAHRCTICREPAGAPCDAPRKPGGFHVARLDAGARHYRRDVHTAPWPEDRTPGARYDSLPRTP